MKYFKPEYDETLFRLLLIVSFLLYLSIAIFIETIPYHPEKKIKVIKRPRKVRLVKSPPTISIPKIEKEKKKIEVKKKIEKRRTLTKKKQKAEKKEVRKKPIKKEPKKTHKQRNREIAKNTGLMKILKRENRSIQKIIKNTKIDKTLSIVPLKSPITAKPSPKKNILSSKVKTKNKNIEVPAFVGEKLSKGLKYEADIPGLKITQADNNEEKGTIARTQDSIKGVVNSRKGGIDFLYRKALRGDPTLKGEIVVEFIISEEGTVIKGRIVSSTLNDPTFEKQVLRRILSWKFPPIPGSGNTVVVYPIVFTPV